jgi:Glycosyl transferase family 2
LRFDICIVTKGDVKPSLVKRIHEILPVERILMSHARPISAARQELCDMAETEWFAFIDDDLIITHNPLTNALPLMTDPKNGAVEVEGVQGDPNAPKPVRAWTRLSFVRKEAVRTMRLPNTIHSEDILMREYLKMNGWQWPLAPGICYIHDRTYKPSEGYEVGYFNYQIGAANFSKSWIGTFSYYPLKLLRERHGKAFFPLMLRQLYNLNGVTRARLNRAYYRLPSDER